MKLTTNTVQLEASGAGLQRIIRSAIIASLCFLLLTGCLGDSIDQQGTPLPEDTLSSVRERGTLRVVSRSNINPSDQTDDSQSGLELELARAFADRLGVGVELIPASSTGEMFAALDRGDADIAASITGQGGSDTGSYRFTTPHLAVSQHVVYRHGTRRPEKMADLVGARVMVLSGSRAADLLAAQQQSLPALSWTESMRLDTFGLLRKVASGDVDYAIVKSSDYALNEGLFPHVESAFDVSTQEQRSWVLRSDRNDDALFNEMQTFLANFERSGEMELLHERLVGYVPEFNRMAVRAFANRAQRALPGLEPMMRRIADEEGVDWHLLASISYQESHWNPNAVSRTGVKGMMMLTRATAAEVGVSDRTNMEQSLRGGARYFKRLLEQLPASIKEPDRTLFALASYNAGSGHIDDARLLAEMRGFDPDRWSDVEQQLPLLTRREWYKHTRHGYARGYETASFVRNIRQYHRFLAYRNQENDPFQVALNERRKLPKS